MVKKKFQLVIYALIIAILVAVAAIGVVFYEKKNTNSAEGMVKELQADIDANKRDTYVALTDITAGEKLVDGVNVQKTTIFSGLDNSIYMTGSDLGKKALVDIKAGAAIQSTMLGEQDITKDTREYEVSVVNLSTHQQNHDVVDVRLVFPDGTDYVVLSKKEVRNLAGTLFDLYLDEDEILRMQSATVDAATLGARFYTTKYVEENLQEEAVPYYPVKQTTLDLINSDPNVLNIAEQTLNTQVRQNLEERMMAMKSSLAEDQTLSADFSSQISVTTEPGASDEEAMANETAADKAEAAPAADAAE